MSWISLSQSSVETFSNPFCINNDEFCVIPERSYAMDVYGGILKYNIPTNTWNVLVEDQQFLSSTHSAAFDVVNDQIVTITDAPQIIIYNISSTSVKKYDIDIVGGKLIYFNNDIHGILGHNNNGQLTWNNIENKFATKKTIFSVASGLVDFGIISVDDQRIFIMGGIYANNHQYNDCIMQYDGNADAANWSRCDLKMPKPMKSFGMVHVNKKILCFGGTNDNGSTDDIFIIDVENGTSARSLIVCPEPGQYHVILVDNKDNDTLCVHGYSRLMTGLLSYELPFYLIQLIGSFHYEQNIFLLKHGTGDVWKIHAPEIVRNVIAIPPKTDERKRKEFMIEMMQQRSYLKSGRNMHVFGTNTNTVPRYVSHKDLMNGEEGDYTNIQYDGVGGELWACLHCDMMALAKKTIKNHNKYKHFNPLHVPTTTTTTILISGKDYLYENKAGSSGTISVCLPCQDIGIPKTFESSKSAMAHGNREHHDLYVLLK